MYGREYYSINAVWDKNAIKSVVVPVAKLPSNIVCFGIKEEIKNDPMMHRQIILNLLLGPKGMLLPYYRTITVMVKKTEKVTLI